MAETAPNRNRIFNLSCAVLFRLFKKRRGQRATGVKSKGFCRFAAAGTRVASRNEKLNSPADQNDRFAAVA
jgi:hypothetical protein